VTDFFRSTPKPPAPKAEPAPAPTTTPAQELAELHKAYEFASEHAADPLAQEIFRETYLAYYQAHLAPKPKGAKA
jgi:hypothetical protein